MKAFAITIALLGAAAAAPINAQLPTRSGAVIGTTQRTNCGYTRSSNTVGDIIFGRTSTVNCRDVDSREDGAWYQVGRGPNNNSTYERRVRDANGNLVIQHARRNPNGTFTILNTRVAGANDKQWKKAQKEERKAWKKQQKMEDKQMKKGEKEENKQIDANYKAASKSNKGKNK